jgi:hypothetical protein
MAEPRSSRQTDFEPRPTQVIEVTEQGPNRSACSITIRLRLNINTNCLITVVATSNLFQLLANRSIAASLSPEFQLADQHNIIAKRSCMVER